MNYKINSESEKETKAQMKSIIKKLENENEIDESWCAALIMLEDNLNTFFQCKKQLQLDGLTITDRFGVTQKHPLLKVQNDAQIQAVKLLTEFGLTLKSSQKLNTNEIKDDSPINQY